MITTQLEELNSSYVGEVGVFLSFGLLVWVIRTQFLSQRHKSDEVK